MADVFFVLKTFLATFILIVLMQVQVGDRTIERHLQSWIHTSSIVRTLDGVAHGATKAINVGYQEAVSMVDGKWGTEFNRAQMAGSHGLGFQADRINEIRKEVESDKAKTAAEQRQSSEDELYQDDQGYKYNEAETY